MKVNAVITRNFGQIKRMDINKYKSTIITFLIMLIAVISGPIFYFFAQYGLKEKFSVVFLSFSGLNIETSKPDIFTGLLVWTFIYLIIMLLCSTSVIGAPLVYLITFLRITSLSTLISYIYSEFGLKGIEYCLIVLLPGKFFLLLSYLIMTDACIEISRNIKAKSIKGQPDSGNISVKIVTAMVFSLLQIVTDYFAIILFSGLFDF